MAEEGLKGNVSVDTVTSKLPNVRRISLPIFQSDLHKDVPNYLRVSIGSCHDFCKHGKRLDAEVKLKRPLIKRNVVVPSVRRNVDKGISTGKTAKAVRLKASGEEENKASKDFSKSLKPKLLQQKSLARKSAATSGFSKPEKPKRQLKIAPSSSISGKRNVNETDSKTLIKDSEDGKHDMVAESAKASTRAVRNLNAREKPSSAPANSKLASKATPRASSSPPHRLTPMIKARLNSSPSQLKPNIVRASSSSSSAIKVKPATVNTTPPSIPPRSLNSKKSIDIRNQIVNKGETSKVRARESAASRSSFESSSVKAAPNMQKKEVGLEKLGDVDVADAETNEFLEKNEGDLSHAAELENQEVMESRVEEVPEKTLYVVEMETGDKIDPDSNGEDEIPDMQPLASLTPPLSPTFQISDAVSDISIEHEASQQELNNSDTALPSGEQETADTQPLPSLSLKISPESQSSNMASNTSSDDEVTQDELSNTDTDLPSDEQETADIQPLPSLSLAVSPETQSSNMASNISSHDEVSEDELINTGTALPSDEQETTDIQPLPSLNLEISPESQSSNMASNISSHDEVSEDELTNTDTALPSGEQETADIQPLPSLSREISPESQSSNIASNISSHDEVSEDELTNTDTALPSGEQETADIQPLPSLSPSISPESQSNIMASNTSSHDEVSQDESPYTESEEDYSSDEDDHLVDGENPKGASDYRKLKKSAKILSEENGQDPVKLRFRRGRVIDITEENHGSSSRRLKFRRGKVLEEKAENVYVRKSSFKIHEATQDNVTTDSNSEAVVLRHQDIQDKKDPQGLFNNVIEETASKLAEKRKSKVKALVGAFETVISLQDGKPTTT